MLTSREIYSPESRVQDSVETKANGSNLDGEFLAAFKDAEDTLVLALQGALKTRDIRHINSRVLAPLFSIGLISQDTLDAFNRLNYHASAVRRNQKTLSKAPPVISRYRKPTEADDRMPGSVLPLDRKRMRALIKQAGSLRKKFQSLVSKVQKPKTQESLKRAFRAY